MLVLMRRPGEAINIGDDVVVTVAKIVGNQVHLGIEAPKDVPVDREEIYEAKERARQGLPPVERKRKTG